MALTWSIENVNNWSAKRRFSVVFDNVVDPLALMTMCIGINKITEDNATEVYTRIKLWETAHGFYNHYDADVPSGVEHRNNYLEHFKNAVRVGDQVSIYSQELINDLIGMYTNASPKSWSKFCADLKPRKEELV